jgi:oleate hydratase
MFAIAPWHGALEMKLYANRFVHTFGGFSDLSVVKWTRLNQYDSLVLPLMTWLEKQGVTVHYDTRVTNVVFDITPDRKVARRIEWLRGGRHGGVDVTENDLVLITNGSPVESTSWATTTRRPSGTGRSARAASGRCGATSPPRTRTSADRTSSAPTPTGAAMCRRA